MSPEEIQLLQDRGEILMLNSGLLVTQSILYGLYAALFALNSRVLLKTSRANHTWILFGFLLALFLVTSFSLALNVWAFMEDIRWDLIANPEQPFQVRLQLSDTAQFQNIFGACLAWLNGSTNGGGLLFLFSDAVVVWRAWVLWPTSSITRIVMLLLLFASFTFNVIAASLSTIILISRGRRLVYLTKVVIRLWTLCLSSSIVTNVVATGLIGHKAYHHRRLVKSTMGNHNTKTSVILCFLAESGAAFCALQLISLGINITTTSTDVKLPIPVQFYNRVLTYAAAAYPQLVLLIVDYHRSIADHTVIAVDSQFDQEPDSGEAGLGGIETHLSFSPHDPNGIGSESAVGMGIASGDCSKDF